MGTSLDSLSAAGKALYDKVAAIFGADNINITSTKRDGTGSSQHNVGDALDFTVNGYSNSQVQSIIANSGITFNQLINEISGPASTGPHVHLGAGTSGRVETYVNGKYVMTDPSTLAANLPSNGPTANNGVGGGFLDSLRGIEGDIVGALGGDSKWWTNPKSDVTDLDPTGTAGFLKSLLTGEFAGRFTAVVIGVILIAIAIAAFALLSDNGKQVINVVSKAAV